MENSKRPSLNVPFSGINSTSMFYFQSVLAISQTPFILSNEKVYKSNNYDIYGGIIARYRKKPEKETLAFPYLLSSSFERWLHCRRSCFCRHHSNEKTVIGIFQTRTLRPVPVYRAMQVRQLANSLQSFYRFFDHHCQAFTHRRADNGTDRRCPALANGKGLQQSLATTATKLK